MSSTASCGYVFPVASDLPTALGVASNSGYHFIVTPIVHPRYRSPESIFSASTGCENEVQEIERNYSFARSDLLLSSSEWSTMVVGMISREPQVQLESSLWNIRRSAEESLKRELTFCGHLGLSAIMVELRRPKQFNLARMMHAFVLKVPNCQVWVRVPLVRNKSAAALASQTKHENDQDTWHWWNDFRSLVDYDRKLGLALEIDSNCNIEEKALARWLGEPVKALVIKTSSFLTNKKGFPVLPRSVQAVVRRFIHLNAQVIIEGRAREHNIGLYQSYIDHLWEQTDNSDPLQRYAKGFEDFLQSPLQPLMDNLESCTYEVFEKDPVKYAEYQRAIYKAIVDKLPNEEDQNKVLKVMVLGAGRGPLVRASLQAASLANRRIKVVAVEKNPNAIVTLLTQKEETWHDLVDVVSSDMRLWNPPEEEKADIIVSELLGSFGDNELSPECLYSAQHLFKEDGISIPASYTSFVGPLQSSKLYNEVRMSRDSEKNPHANFETPYVVHLQNRVELAKPKPLFTFVHPLREPIDNNRYCATDFVVDLDSTLHGFGGYFECILYKDVVLSINPETHSKGMFSWFPIFFPLKTPVKIRKGDEVELHFWRINNSKEVWYEWAISKPIAVPIHNPNGRSYTIGL